MRTISENEYLPNLKFYRCSIEIDNFLFEIDTCKKYQKNYYYFKKYTFQKKKKGKFCSMKIKINLYKNNFFSSE